jgi:FeS assembly SUF system protein
MNEPKHKKPQDGGHEMETEARRFLPVMGHIEPAGEPLEAEEITVQGRGGPGPGDPAIIQDQILAGLKTVFDPEIPVNIYDLGLIYGLEVSPHGEVEIRMTLTAPGCPVAGQLVREVAEKASSVDGVVRAHVELVWDPPWDMQRMTEEAKLELGLL